jgi:hypothetical protein
MATLAACNLIDSLAEFQFDVIRRVNRKFIALQRLAELLEQLGDISTLIPNIAKLIDSFIPVANIDLELYNQLASACPFLNLPAPGEASLAELQARVVAAYSNLTRQLLNHPWLRMGLLQNQLARFQSKVDMTLATGLNFIQCLQAACQAVEGTASFFEGISNADVQKEITSFTTNFVEQGGSVLSEGARTKNTEAKELIDQMKALGADVGDDYTTAKAKLST